MYHKNERQLFTMKRKGLFLKRITVLPLSLLILSQVLVGCKRIEMGMPDTQNDGRTESNTSDIDHTGENTQTENETMLPGNYTVPEGWVKMDEYSSGQKIFYAAEGYNDLDETPDNISIEVGTNRYSADEHEKFRDAIMRQLAMQLQGIDAELTGSGTYTEQEYILYVFTIIEEGVVTKQYYIVDDKRYCLIHLTNFSGSEDAEEAAQAMVDSFVWN